MDTKLPALREYPIGQIMEAHLGCETPRTAGVSLGSGQRRFSDCRKALRSGNWRIGISELPKRTISPSASTPSPFAARSEAASGRDSVAKAAGTATESAAALPHTRKKDSVQPGARFHTRGKAPVEHSVRQMRVCRVPNTRGKVFGSLPSRQVHTSLPMRGKGPSSWRGLPVRRAAVLHAREKALHRNRLSGPLRRNRLQWSTATRRFPGMPR